MLNCRTGYRLPRRKSNGIFCGCALEGDWRVGDQFGRSRAIKIGRAHSMFHPTKTVKIAAIIDKANDLRCLVKLLARFSLRRFIFGAI
jgi:hypothetical protein